MLDQARPNSRSFVPDRAAGLARLEAFVPASGRTYAGTRNSDYGPDDRRNVSVLSPYIRHRLVTETEVLQAVLGRYSLATAEKFVQEVLWRTYFKGYLETRPAIWSRYEADRDQQLAALERGGGLAKAYRAAIEGRTGIDCFDAWVEELVETGYLHNHARMWFASIWIFTLRLPWELGADFTLRHFIDGDPASNTLSWRWVGGLHTRGKTYLARADNIVAHTNGRFAPKGLAREAIALDEPPLPAAERPSLAPDRVPAGLVALLLTEEDLHPESLPRGGSDIVAVASADALDARSPLPVAENVRRFVDGALADARTRASSAFAAPSEALPSLTAIALRDFARRHDVRTIVTAHAPVGPVRAALDAAEAALKKDGIALVRVRRALDTVAWPYATKGFFALKERIPTILREIGLGA